MSPLVAAALASSVSTLQLLLVASASADATDQHQRTALTAAAATGSLPLPGMFEKSSFHFFLEVWDERIPAQCGYCIFRCDVKIKIYYNCIYHYTFCFPTLDVGNALVFQQRTGWFLGHVPVL